MPVKCNCPPEESRPPKALPRHVDDWTGLTGSRVEIRKDGQVHSAGIVDAVTSDGMILWLQPPSDQRRLYEKSASYEVWVHVAPG